MENLEGLLQLEAPLLHENFGGNLPWTTKYLTEVERPKVIQDYWEHLIASHKQREFNSAANPVKGKT